MSLKSLGLNRRQMESMVNAAFEQMKMDINREYANVLILQGRAKDVGYLSDAERDMEAMCDAYRIVMTRVFAKVLESNNKKIADEIDQLIKGS